MPLPRAEFHFHDPEKSLPATEFWRPALPFLMFVTAQGAHVPWVASQTDLLGGDWVRVPAGPTAPRGIVRD